MQEFYHSSIDIDLYGLAYECPCRKRTETCPLKDVEMLSFREKVEWINGLSEEEKRSIWNQHKVCFEINRG
jgi:hypothetical protein